MGDRAKALAEYRLALRQAGDSARALLRLAHAYGELDQAERAREFYERAVAVNPGYSDQAVADLVRLAERAFVRGDGFGGVAAAEAALRMRPGVSMPGLDLPLARAYARAGQQARAIPYYERALVQAPQDSMAEVLYELALSYEELRDCRRALVFFERYRHLARSRGGQSVEWHVGSCSLQLARSARAAGDHEEALQRLATVILLGEPRNRLDEAYFERGEILFARREHEAALEAYRKVLELNVAVRGPLATRAERRIEEIRFGRP